MESDLNLSRAEIQTLFSNLSVSISKVDSLILKTIYFILQNMFRSLHTSSSVVHIKSTVNVQIIKGLFFCNENEADITTKKKNRIIFCLSIF